MGSRETTISIIWYPFLSLLMFEIEILVFRLVSSDLTLTLRYLTTDRVRDTIKPFTPWFQVNMEKRCRGSSPSDRETEQLGPD